MIRIVGGDTVGMSTVPEVIVANHMELPCMALSIITDLGVEEKIVEISGLDYIIYRPHNIYGPRMGSSHVIPELINKLIIKKNKIIKIYSPNHKRVFCYIDDCIFQIISTCFNKKFLNNVINLGSSQKEIKIYDLAKLINKFATKQKKITPGNVTLGSPYRRIPSINKISSVVRKYKETKLDQGIKKTIEWYKND